eukprot:scaffold25451_cov73-Skeletonema_dohrnii-CCMP3373.AAC.2
MEMRSPPTPTQRVRAHDLSIQLPNTFTMKKPQSSATLTDLGYSHMPRGWYDAQGTGFSIDYGRYVGDHGNAANPIRWAVALAGKKDHATLTDLGYSHMPRGWYDAQGSGFSIDYGRYVGDHGNAANPIRWSVALAGKTEQYATSYSEPDNSLLMPDHDWQFKLGTEEVKDDPTFEVTAQARTGWVSQLASRQNMLPVG